MRRAPAWLVAGLAAALVSSAPGLAWVLAQGEPWWRPVQAIATLVGIDELDRLAAPALLVGAGIHLALSLAYALAFLPFASHLRGRGVLIAAGAAWGVLIWTTNFVVADALGWFAALRSSTDATVELGAHLVYGIVLAGVLAGRGWGTLEP